ncbi:flavin reductase family protein [Candidatus Bipolaricaulota bacterium]
MKRSLGPRTLAMPAPVWIVGTYDAEDRPNLMTAAWAGICCSKPPAITVSLRKATHTYQSILDRQAFTVGIPSVGQAAIADYIGMVSGREVDKFAAAGLTAKKAGHVDAPVAEEFPLSLECRLIHTLEVGLHTMFVGEIVDVQAEEATLGESERPSISKLNPLIWAVTESEYYAVGEFVGQGFSLGKAIRDQE